ncbi:dynamin family protein [Campylobacter ureolyticus]|uniref:dynamin family protein n=1 Tax=Campylobacter ureolyticus TaxID=827 RepID=UPI0022B5BB3A|nr:dynamin family protein [Campylobacter ureolyticus]MCZ6174510.1 dynamin family protein [Campylobacter ureolyticus]MCZ6186223.1 dynamin family protein [Campylobacter ureolyticus]
MKTLIQNYTTFLKSSSDILSNINISHKKQDELLNLVQNTELLIPVVGGFSAGKSTLINKYLGDNILSTGITPETALATELRYSDGESFFEAVTENGSIQKFNISESTKINENSKNFTFLKLYLNNDKLKEIEPLILVDMPGFDAPVELHNKAILNYLSKGKFFVVLVSADDGNITKSIMRELENINEFGKDFIVCISKTNLKSSNDNTLILNKVKEQLVDEFDYDKEVVQLGNDSGFELEKILKNIDSKELFKSLYLDELKQSSFEAQDTINLTISSLQNSKEEAQNAINELQNSITKLKNKKDNAINEIQNRYSNSAVDGIINAVATELMSSSDNLARLANNPSNLESEINSIVKTTLVREVKNRLQVISENIVGDFGCELKGLNLDDFGIDDSWISKIEGFAIDNIKKLQSGLTDILSNRDKNSTDPIYKIITTIFGITTTVLNPVLELIMIFLPEILSVFTGKSREQKMIENAKNQLISNIIPSIKTKLREALPKLLEEQVNATIEFVALKFEEELKTKSELISKTINEKSSDLEKTEKQIEGLKNSLNELKNLTTKFLY